MQKKAPYKKQKDLYARAAFIQAVLSLLEEKPFQKISASEIIIRSGYSRGSFYKYFEDKFDLMRKITAEEAEHYTAILCGNIRLGRQKKSVLLILIRLHLRLSGMS